MLTVDNAGKKRIKFYIFYLLPVLFWVGAIFYFSHQPGLKIGLITPLEALVRKVAHVIEFGGLALLLWRMFRGGLNWPSATTYVTSFCIAASAGVVDEIHQLFVTNRSGQFIDMLVDILAVFIVLQISYVISVRKLSRFFLGGIISGVFMLIFVVGWIVVEAEGTYHVNEAHKQALKEGRKIDWGSAKTARDAKEATEAQFEKENSEDLSKIEIKISEVSGELKIQVPFTSQAPFVVWDDVHEEACEEASLLMVKYFLEGSELTKIPPVEAEEEIQKMKDFQLENYGTYKDSDMEGVVQLAEEFYDIKNLKVIYDFDRDEIKKQLAEKKPIIIPTAGQELGNPNFTPPGPLYHNLVLIGYDGNTIITNDPGTRKGQNYTYDIDVLYSSIHDFPGDKNRIKEGRKAMIVVE